MRRLLQLAPALLLLSTLAPAQLLTAPPEPKHTKKEKHEREDVEWIWQFTPDKADPNGRENDLARDLRFRPLLDRFLTAPQSFWGQPVNGHYPALADVALDFLTVPGKVLADDNRYVSISGSVVHFAPARGLLWIDLNGAHHLVAEFVVRLTVNRPALRAIALTTDTSILTAGGNDFGFDRIFSRQVEALGQPGDVFLGISTSGNSPNILKALHQARKQNLATIGFSGNDGGKMRSLCDHNVIVPSNVTMNIQESHLALEHIFCMVVERCLFGMDFDTKPQILSE